MHMNIQKNGYRYNNPYFLSQPGCPANQYGSPRRPCHVHCDQCNTIDGSCVCQAGYKGDNCTEGNV